MKKTLSLIIIFFSLSTYSQKSDTISIKINATNLTEALNQIENQTNFSFYYQKKWLKNNGVSINENFDNASIDTLLKAIFKDTNLNFYLSGKHVILTENNIIYDKVSSDFLENSDLNHYPEYEIERLFTELDEFEKKYSIK